MRARILFPIAIVAALCQISPSPVAAQAPTPTYANQGPDWTPATRNAFYIQDQGSQLIPLAWMRALKKSDGSAFLADSLSRYGYLPNPANPNGLPVGFSAAGESGAEILGMTCAACHTRQISVSGQPMRIDGGPAIVDFQSFLTDIDTAVGAALQSDDAFRPFANSVLGAQSADTSKVLALRVSVSNWYLRFHTLMATALPKTPAAKWGPSRLDAVGMILNRLTGLDLGPEPSYLIPGNIRPADAPVRYPFLWNAARQDKTQWPGFAENGDSLLALPRNVGEVFGVFGGFQPRRIFNPFNIVTTIDFLHGNSVNFDGLGKLEDLIRKIGKPAWAWSFNEPMRAKGEEIFGWPTDKGGCAECHAIKPGKPRLSATPTWKTCVRNVGTDLRQYDILNWDADTGVLEGAFVPGATKLPLKAREKSIDLLKTSVLGSILANIVYGSGLPQTIIQEASVDVSDLFKPSLLLDGFPPALKALAGAYNDIATGIAQNLGLAVSDCDSATAPYGAYEARVMEGIWAAAPYLHNGSVSSLADLLKPWQERKASFKVGPAYDLDNVGLATDQTAFDFTLETTGCDDLHSGRSRCGHEFGLVLKPDEKAALLEYLKTL